ncbi:MAG: ATP-binding protein [Gammaproteobacteria bacterium]|nr:ATP-binding protein [Gammaproteobacteria bacterium]
MKTALKNLKHIKILNRLGQALDVGSGSRSGYPAVVQQFRSILELSAVSLWVIDRKHQLLVKEAMDFAPTTEFSEAKLALDEKLTYWQLEHRQRVLIKNGQVVVSNFNLAEQYSGSVISLPLIFMQEVFGVLNLHGLDAAHWLFKQSNDADENEFLRAISGQMAVFVHNKSLEANTTFYKEIHHRVKNNLQTVASLLRMQIRRLDKVPPKQVLEDSINRILSIALVHETLSQGEIGMVNLGDLITRIVNLLMDNLAEKPQIIINLSGAVIMLNSKQATSVALVLNELLHNACQHGLRNNAAGTVIVEVARDAQNINIAVMDDGVGLASDFNVDTHSHLGLTIVAALVADDLHGQLIFSQNTQTKNIQKSQQSELGTRVELIFPLRIDSEFIYK